MNYQLTKQTRDEVISKIDLALTKKPLLVVSIEDGSIGKWTMTRLWRSWMSSTAKFMSLHGVTMPLYFQKCGHPMGKRKFNEYDAHELFTHQYMGADADGNRLSWAKKPSEGERVATKGERFNAMLKHQEWMTGKGIKHMVPKDSEFYKTMEETGS